MRTILLLILVIFFSCEKDDICTEETTPKLVIDFYEYLNPTIKKNFLKLEISEISNPNTILTIEHNNQVKLPLKTDATQSTYLFRLYYTSLNNVVYNDDIISINYTKSDIYVSRACGFKSNFTLHQSSLDNTNPTVSDPNQDGFWIKESVIKQNLITNENETHLDLLF
ncbi:MAG: DUF6452 family protein [Bacteroidota bacterium]|nr:DUF6452 family protein [Bacteroidota bacterium]